MRSPRLGFVLALGALSGLLLTSIPVLAHHSTAMYNMASPVTVTGVVKTIRMDEPARVRLSRRQGREGRDGRVGSRDDEPQPSARLRLGARHGQAGRRHFLHRRIGEKRRAFDDQLLHEAGGWPHDQIVDGSSEGARRYENRDQSSRLDLRRPVPRGAGTGAGARATFQTGRRTGRAESRAGRASGRLRGVTLRQSKGHSRPHRPLHGRAHIPSAGAVGHARVAHGKPRQRDDRSGAGARHAARHAATETGSDDDLHLDRARARTIRC